MAPKLGRIVKLVSAPAGTGKTALVSAWASQAHGAIASLTLQAGDESWTVFWTALTQALGRCGVVVPLPPARIDADRRAERVGRSGLRRDGDREKDAQGLTSVARSGGDVAAKLGAQMAVVKASANTLAATYRPDPVLRGPLHLLVQFDHVSSAQVTTDTTHPHEPEEQPSLRAT